MGNRVDEQSGMINAKFNYEIRNVLLCGAKFLEFRIPAEFSEKGKKDFEICVIEPGRFRITHGLGKKTINLREQYCLCGCSLHEQ